MSKGLAALRVLVIDDNPQMRTIIGSVLRAVDVRNIHYAPDGRIGVDAVLRLRPDICFVDYEMPNMNGLDFVSMVRGMGGPERFTPIIMLTGHSDMLRLTKARDRGVNEFLGKPVTAKAILARLEAVIFRPRPFIDAPTFFGPDRRRRVVPDYAGPLRRDADQSVLSI